MTQVLDPAPALAVCRSRRPSRSRVPYLRTVGLYAVTLWALVTLAFFLPRFMPGDPLRQLDDPDSGTFLHDPAER